MLCGRRGCPPASHAQLYVCSSVVTVSYCSRLLCKSHVLLRVQTAVDILYATGAEPCCVCCMQGRGSGVNFALPADLLLTTVPNLIVYGTAAGRGVRTG
jgi:hypothetical protein